MIRHLRREQFLAADASQVWEFFSTPRNLDVLTPDSLRFRICGEVAARMHAGQIIEYRISFFPGVWTRWVTEITHVEDGRYFVDEQRIGPYRLWHHEHRFESVAGGVRMTDHVIYDVGWGWLGGLIDRIWVSRTVNRIFEFRAQKVAGLFGGRS